MRKFKISLDFKFCFSFFCFYHKKVKNLIQWMFFGFHFHRTNKKYNATKQQWFYFSINRKEIITTTNRFQTIRNITNFILNPSWVLCWTRFTEATENWLFLKYNFISTFVLPVYSVLLITSFLFCPLIAICKIEHAYSKKPLWKCF